MLRIDLHQNEKVLQKHRQTWLILSPKIVLSVFLVLLPFYYLAKYQIFSDFRRLFTLWVIIILFFLARKLIVWWLNEYLITNQRLIRISHEGLFKKLVLETPLERILNVSFKTTGFWSSSLSYGDVEVQVVGLMEPVILKHIRHPSKIKDYLWQLHAQTTKEKHEFKASEIPRVQEKLGYTKENQKIL